MPKRGKKTKSRLSQLQSKISGAALLSADNTATATVDHSKFYSDGLGSFWRFDKDEYGRVVSKRELGFKDCHPQLIKALLYLDWCPTKPVHPLLLLAKSI